jgi:hypothetical protein
MKRFSLLFFQLVIETVSKVDEEVIGIVLLEPFELKITKKKYRRHEIVDLTFEGPRSQRLFGFGKILEELAVLEKESAFIFLELFGIDALSPVILGKVGA